MAVTLELLNVSKIFRKDRELVRAVDNVSMTVAPGEMVTFLGPSGCGKTTTLRMVAGFETPSGGTITIDGQDVTNVPVNRRDIGFVFQ
ncbi:MAG TPA: ATP-binding cassette domain-containing protein, partial [Aminivibrio sp.]|nr:ATP-binding cassette domain-containing protein [Aminivibrio sp.]